VSCIPWDMSHQSCESKCRIEPLELAQPLPPKRGPIEGRLIAIMFQARADIR
jgi:hypothetical protein